MHDDQGELELRPGFGIVLILLAALGLGGACAVAAILIGDAPKVFAPIVGAIWMTLITLGAAASLASRITLTSDEIVVRGPFTRQRRPRSRIAKAARATIHVPRGANNSLILLDADGRLLVRMSVDHYNREDIDRLVQMLDVPCSGPDAFRNAKEFERTYPGTLSWVERHPYRIAFAITAVVLVAIAMAVALVAGATAS
ncbi:hypothetical protein E1264_23405 [Actinomadura sp. KC216]|uniref:hypothetical protein n=1 Tax=Actinomadura sp. KC216 TaxID=2530370 RepID=UPI00104904D1|nr:hypothetical protein [Actinomadura sp. KC216]TDB84816.1 hypothetical protein E1264_23405 [Actinomadura sp. KC216]